MSNDFYDPSPTPGNSLNGTWDWIQATSSQPVSAGTLDLSDSNLIYSASEEDAWILHNDNVAAILPMAEHPLPTTNSLSSLHMADVLTFEAVDLLLQHPRPDAGAWLPPAGEDLSPLGVNLDSFQYLDPVVWERPVQGIGPGQPTLNNSLGPLQVGGEGGHQLPDDDQCPIQLWLAAAAADGNFATSLAVDGLESHASSSYQMSSPSASGFQSASSSSPSSSSPTPLAPSSQPHPAANAHRCSECTATFARSRDLRTHRLKHTRPFACPVCSRGHASRKDMYRHAWTHHAAEAALLGLPVQKRRCPVRGCGVEERGDNLTRHLRTKHRGLELTAR